MTVKEENVDEIHLLNDVLANQIAAGEVIQRPASVAKELLENAIDAKATKITLSFTNGGKTGIQVTDNGKGMSETDARMSFERHATSKIQTSDDLLAIHTNGFRGEALASIAAIAKVDLKTARSGDAMGTQIKIDAGKLIVQEPCSAKQGATFSVQSLFYNVPARRKFLKSDAAESRHIIEAFEKVALSHPEVAMELYNNKSIVYKLEAGKLRKRIVQLFGNNFDEKLLPLSENTNIVNLSGFLIKPEYSKKTRGEQFFFANNRFIKSPYLHHAIVNAFEGMISKENNPECFL